MKLVWAAAGFAAGYVMGTKAGRQRYEQLREAASAVLNQPVVAQTRARVAELAERGLETAAAKAGIRVEHVDSDDANGTVVAGPKARQAATF
ncbi:hypothetical protein [Catelliglobosispora koreensis]|uniref:hypothetical protein n=1 Tax=Catelliglobosispora koreensis TaxID=129052 RepID=UPI000374161B|nr:hypothetical protein [Catelliglobosispora koreensis]